MRRGSRNAVKKIMTNRLTKVANPLTNLPTRSKAAGNQRSMVLVPGVRWDLAWVRAEAVQDGVVGAEAAAGCHLETVGCHHLGEAGEILESVADHHLTAGRRKAEALARRMMTAKNSVIRIYRRNSVL